MSWRYYATSEKPRSRLEGPVQERDTGFHFYPCNRGGCWILCRCKLCSGQLDDTHYHKDKICNDTDDDEDEENGDEESEDKEDDIQSGVKDETACYKCLGQCKEHRIKLKRSFSSETDSFSIAVSGVEFKPHTPPVYFERHPGIPRSCWLCQHDLEDHQLFHQVLHYNCKFCVKYLNILTNVCTREEYVKSVKLDEYNETKKCKICFKEYRSQAGRKKHEAKFP